MPMPEVRLGQPEIIENYNYYDANGIKIYILKSLEVRNNTISVKLNSFLWLKSVGVTGFKVL